MSSLYQRSFPATLVTPIPVDPYITHIDDRKRFVMLVSGIFTAAAISAHYSFALVSNYLKDRYHYGQSELTMITTVGASVGALSFPAGVVFDHLGASAAIALPCVVGTIGFVLLGLTFSGFIDASVFLFSAFYAIICWGTSSMDTGSLMTNILNFPRDRGAVVVLQKTFNGLGSSILAVLFSSFFPQRYDILAFFTGCVVFVFGMIGATFLRLPPYHLTTLQMKNLSEDEIAAREVTRDIYMTERPSQRRLAVGYVVVATLILFLTTQSIVVTYLSVQPRDQIILASVTVFIFASIVLIALPLRCLDAPGVETCQNTSGSSPTKFPRRNVGAVGSRVSKPFTTHEEVIGDAGGLLEPFLQSQPSQRQSYASTLPGSPPERIPEPQYQGSFLEDLLFLDTWLLFWTGFCNWGTGNLFLANTAQIYRSMNNNHYVDSTNTLYVTLIGVGSALGRVVMGCIEIAIEKRSHPCNEELLHPASILQRVTRNLHVIMVYPIPSALMSAGLVLILLIPVEGLVVPLVLVSFAFGYSWACTALVVRSLFAKDVGKHYSFLFLGSFCANILLNRFMFGELFDSEGRKMGLYPFCSGRQCVQTSFLILLGLNLTALAASVVACSRFLRYASQEFPRSRQALHPDDIRESYLH